jgi:hypothetical protein
MEGRAGAVFAARHQRLRASPPLTYKGSRAQYACVGVTSQAREELETCLHTLTYPQVPVFPYFQEYSQPNQTSLLPIQGSVACPCVRRREEGIHAKRLPPCS